MDICVAENWDGEILYLPEPTGQSAMIAQVRDYWRAQCRDGRFPRRGDIDPLGLRGVLPYLSIMEFAPPTPRGDPFRIKFRLVGSELARFYGSEVTGKWLDEIPDWSDVDTADTLAVFRRVYDSAAPVYGLSLCLWEENPDHVFEFGCFPLSEDGRNVTHCLGIDDYTMIAPRPPRAI
ncbi:PAS domain-containing protein [Dongia mobilis]|uniref:PAS domain-containing protein n=1 Tax=Dongia mobilis TaxID=578943 RepID=A0A4R6WUU4_9PROT|nr:PAS domain-containing protein [Dongia mobilis]